MCAIATTLLAGARAVTNAANAPHDPLTANDVDAAGPIYRDGPAAGRMSAKVGLDASGGVGELGYRIVSPPMAGGERVGDVALAGDTATLSISAQAKPGPAAFRYRAIDEDGAQSDIATVSFEIEDQPPLTRDLSYSTWRNTALDIWPYARDAEDGGPFPWQDPDNRITYGKPEHGVVRPFFDRRDELVAIGHKATYVPDDGYTGPDRFRYTFTDSEGVESTATIEVDVREPVRAKRGEVTGVGYRCPLRAPSGDAHGADRAGGYDPEASTILSRALGGDVSLLVDLRVRAPRSVRPGATYQLADPRLRVRLPQAMAELLVGGDPAGVRVDLATTGLGQTSIALSANARLQVREGLSSKASEVPLPALVSSPAELTLPVPADGLALPLDGDDVTLAAPSSGDVTVAMPAAFDLAADLEPGLQDAVGSLGLHCHLADSAGERDLIGIAVREPTRTSTAVAEAPYGESTVLGIGVSDSAAGRIRVFDGTDRIAVGQVRDGRATIPLGPTALEPGTHRLRVTYVGNQHLEESTDKVWVRVRR